jgi:2-polyprenyl-3-methyl-5-hydroxy-6-metoxy-1,4-benzoquinol methylase
MTTEHYTPDYFAKQVSKSDAKVAWQYGRLLHYANIDATRYPRFLDAGCGAGPALGFLEKQGFKVTGSDLVLYPLLEARKRSATAGLVNADLAQGLPFKTASFDVILASEVIEHLADAEALLAECRRVLAPGGCLILTTPNLWDLRRPWAKLTRQIWSGYQDPTHINLMTPPRLTGLVRQAGFAKIKWKSGVKPWWAVRLRKIKFSFELPYPPIIGNGLVVAAYT